MSVSGIHGHVLEVTVVGCSKLKDTEWISRQDPYVCLEYGSTKTRTRTCTDGGKNPTFQEKHVFTLIEGLREIGVVVWNSNTLKLDDFIGSGKIQLHKVLSEGYDDSTWPLQTKHGRYAGEVRVIMDYANTKKHGTSGAYSTMPHGHVPPYSAPPPTAGPYGTSLYAPPQPAPYSTPSPYSSYPPSSAYPPSTYPPHPPTAYPPSYPPPPPSAYPPQPSPYPPPPSSYPLGPYPGPYPPRPY